MDRREKEDGGLGVKNLEDLNHCLVMKIVHRLHDEQDRPWKRWFLSQHRGTLWCQDVDSFIAKLVMAEIQRYRSITRVQIGDGRTTSFWQDCWLLSTPIAETFPMLFSHTTSPNISVHEATHTDIRMQLQPRLTNAARDELRCCRIAFSKSL